MWPVYVFNLVAALLIAGWFLNAVRRLERRMDERTRRYNEWADAEEAKWDVARDEIIASILSSRPLDVLTRSKAEAVIEAAKSLGEDPLFEDHVQAVEEYRRIHNTTDGPE